MPFPFEVGFDEVQSDLDAYVEAVFACLDSEFLVMPKGMGFVEFSTFESGYESLKRATGNFHDVTPETVGPAVFKNPISLIVLRCMLGFTPPEWAYYASRHTGIPSPRAPRAQSTGIFACSPRKLYQQTEASRNSVFTH